LIGAGAQDDVVDGERIAFIAGIGMFAAGSCAFEIGNIAESTGALSAVPQTGGRPLPGADLAVVQGLPDRTSESIQLAVYVSQEGSFLLCW
jgi:hypothetical protein